MNFTPYPHQDAGIEWIVEHPACALLWGMGTGKTVTTLTAINALLYELLEDGPVLVIAPKRVAENTWSKETAKWEHLHHLRISRVMGTAKQRQEALAAKADIYVINRDNVQWLVEASIGWPFDTVVVDESSSFKNPQARRFKALRKVRPKIRRLILLTGTPSPNGHMDLWSQMWLIDMGQRLGHTLGAYRTRYFRPGRSNGHVVYDWHLRPGAADEISARMADVCVSLKAEDWLEVPDLIESDTLIALSPSESKAYRDFERDQLMSLDGKDIEALTAASLANKLLQFTGGAMYDTEHGWHEVSDATLRALEDLIETSGEEPVLVFYQYKHELERLRERFRSLDPVEFSGEPEVLQAWNEGRIRLMLCQPASVQYGLNMQAGGHIIVWYTPTWNLEQYQQANARLHRQGQERPVLCYRLICEGTIDNRVIDAISAKDTAQESLLAMIREFYAEKTNK